jgi:hypothetical protein
MAKSFIIGLIWTLIFFGAGMFLSTLDGLIFKILYWLCMFFVVMCVITTYKKMKN